MASLKEEATTFPVERRVSLYGQARSDIYRHSSATAIAV
jgi:hypothetical protein